MTSFINLPDESIECYRADIRFNVNLSLRVQETRALIYVI